MNEDANKSDLTKTAIKAAAVIALGTFAHKNSTRIFNKENFKLINDKTTAKIFNDVKVKSEKINPKLSNVVMKRQNPISNHYSATSTDSAINVLGPVKGTLGMGFLRMTNDPVYKQASKMVGKEATNEDMLKYIIGHEFGHQDHFSKNITYDESGHLTSLTNFLNRNKYKENPYEVHADKFAELLYK